MHIDPYTTPWAGFHASTIHLGPQSCRCLGLLNKATFDHMMDVFNWRMPYHLWTFHCSSPETATVNSVPRAMPEFTEPLKAMLFTTPAAPIRLKGKWRRQALPIRSKYSDYTLAETKDGYGHLYRVDGITPSLTIRLETHPIAIQEVDAYVETYHRHNVGSEFHKLSLYFQALEEPGPAGVTIVSVPKAHRQMDNVILEINRYYTNPYYAGVCSSFYTRTTRIGREMGYTRFLTYTLPEESGSNLRAMGLQLGGTVYGSFHGQDSPSRPRTVERYSPDDKLRWVLLAL